MVFQFDNMKLLPKFLAQPMFLLQKTIPSNLKFRPCGSLERNWQIFFWAELETSSHFPPKLPMAFQFDKIKLLPKFLAQPISFLEKPIPSNLKFQPCGSLERNWQIFSGLNWKPVVGFSPNLPWPFSVITLNLCHSFWLNQCTFLKKPIPSTLKFGPSGSLGQN